MSLASNEIRAAIQTLGLRATAQQRVDRLRVREVVATDGAPQSGPIHATVKKHGVAWGRNGLDNVMRIQRSASDGQRPVGFARAVRLRRGICPLNSFCGGSITIFCMHKMSPIPTVPIALHIRAARIPIHWTVREHAVVEVSDLDGRVLTKGGVERVFWPQVEKTKWGDVELTEIEDPLKRRIHLFKIFNTNRTEAAALDFLHLIGAWRTVKESNHEEWAKGTHANVTYGHRRGIGLRVLPTTLDELLRETKRWYKLVGIHNPKKLEVEFKQPPPNARPVDRDLFAMEAHFVNTLPVSLEWHGKDPYAVIETISAWELMIAAAWSDVVSRAEEQVCARCGTRFTWHRKKKHCRWECGHLAAVLKYKRKKALKKRKEKEAAESNPAQKPSR
jgi:hypothetical protein